MLHLTVSRSAGEAIAYFDRELTDVQASYYGNGVWRGKGAESLGLVGPVQRAQFVDLLNNRIPGGTRLTQRTKKNRQYGYDFTFSLPKSVSVYLEASQDRECELACKRALHRVLGRLESDMRCKVRKGGVDEDRTTAEMLLGVFEHQDARPLDGLSDPHRHWHCYAINATFDPVEQIWKSGQFRQLMADSFYYQEYWHAALAEELQKSGYVLRSTTREKCWKGWDLACVDDRLIDLFSKKHHQIDDLAEEQEITSGAAEAILARNLRSSKDTNLFKTIEQKRANWRDQAGPDWDSLTREKAREPVARSINVEQVCERVLSKVFDKHSAVWRTKLIAALLKESRGAMTIDQAETFMASPRFLHIGHHVTTPELKREEDQMRALAMAGRDKCTAFEKAENIRPAGLPDELELAYKACLTSRDRVYSISGIAGAGKSQLLSRLKQKIGDRIDMIFLAPTNPSTANLREAGLQARTLQGFLAESDRFALPAFDRSTLVVLDESSFSSVPDMRRFLELAAARNFRVLLAGDWDQKHSVQRGDAVRILEESASVRFSTLKENRRSKVTWLKAAVEDLKAHRQDKGFSRLERMGRIQEIQDPKELRKAAVEKNLEAIRSGQSSLAIAPRHADCRKLAAEMRASLKAEGLLDTVDHQVDTLRRIDIEETGKRFTDNYPQGAILVCHSRTKGGFEVGKQYRIHSVNGSVELERDGIIQQFDVSQPGRWGVYTQAKMDVAKGDLVRTTENCRQEGTTFHNNEILKVAEITESHLVFEDGRKMRRDGARIDQGYAVTVDASQCRGVDRGVVLADGCDAKGFYVAVTRFKYDVQIFTRNKEQLRIETARNGERVSIWELEQTSAIQKADRSKVFELAQIFQDQQQASQQAMQRREEMNR